MNQYERHDRPAICGRITSARLAAGLTQEQAAAALGLSTRGYQHYERDRVPYRRLAEVAKLFGVEPRWLVYGEDDLRARVQRLEQQLADLSPPEQ